MSIYIKGMEIPTRCGRCDFRISAFDDGMFDHYECCITAAIIDNLGEKMQDCPLVPVPDRGRILNVLKTERECVSRMCDRKCGKCDLALEQSEILSTYDALIAMLDPADKEGEE